MKAQGGVGFTKNALFFRYSICAVVKYCLPEISIHVTPLNSDLHGDINVIFKMFIFVQQLYCDGSKIR